MSGNDFDESTVPRGNRSTSADSRIAQVFTDCSLDVFGALAGRALGGRVFCRSRSRRTALISGPSWLSGRRSHREGSETVTKFLARIVAWITAGYPEGVPGPDRVPLLALLSRRLTDDDVRTVAEGLIDRGEFDHVDIGVLITQITDGLPAPEDVERVRSRLAAQGWPLDDAREPEGDE
jgi:hypothetical protein